MGEKINKKIWKKYNVYEIPRIVVIRETTIAFLGLLLQKQTLIHNWHTQETHIESSTFAGTEHITIYCRIVIVNIILSIVDW